MDAVASIARDYISFGCITTANTVTGRVLDIYTLKSVSQLDIAGDIGTNEVALYSVAITINNTDAGICRTW